jgi:pullulanase/glycogen debranching enzyme
VILESDRIPREPTMTAPVRPVECAGRSSPVGATIPRAGVNFNVFSRRASGVELFFHWEYGTRPARVIRSEANLTGYYGHVFVRGAASTSATASSPTIIYEMHVGGLPRRGSA